MRAAAAAVVDDVLLLLGCSLRGDENYIITLMNGRRLLTAGLLVSTLEHDKKFVDGVLYQSARPADGLHSQIIWPSFDLGLNSEF